MAKNKFGEWSLALLRAVLGFIFAYHGYLKLFTAGGLPGTALLFSKIGIPFPNIFAVIVAFAEFGGGILLLIGLLTRFTSLALIFEMLVAFFKIHLKNGFIITQNSYGYEFILLILICLFIILINGAGKLSLGKLFSKGSLLK